MTVLTMQWNQSGLDATSVLEATSDSGESAADLIAIRDAYQTRLRPVQVTATGLRTLTWLKPTPIVLGVLDDGTLTGQASPPNSCYLVDKNGNIGRRGRWFLPGLAEDDTFSDGTISPTRRTAVTNACNNFLADLAADGITLGIRRVGDVFDPIQNFQCQALIGVQRRRLGR